jgi:catechol 2,3-dioxygenase-like lactoylglutathione lyase family enzyme
MLGSANVMAFVATAKPAEARRFYESVLGLSLVEDSPFALVFDASGTMLRVQKVEEAVVAPYTCLGWAVDDITATVRQLVEAGVQFERFDGMPQADDGTWRTPDGSEVAWFKDPDGNLLSLTQFA